jgi:hypothetical protein
MEERRFDLIAVFERHWDVLGVARLGDRLGDRFGSVGLLLTVHPSSDCSAPSAANGGPYSVS